MLEQQLSEIWTAIEQLHQRRTDLVYQSKPLRGSDLEEAYLPIQQISRHIHELDRQASLLLKQL